MASLLENQHSERLSLNGTWNLSLAGQEGEVQVPGVWERQGFPMYVEGPALYRRRQLIPASWAGARIMLCFQAVSYLVEVRVNGQIVGTHEGLWTAFEFDVSAWIRPGEENEFELQIIKPGDEGDTYPYREVLVGFIPYVSLTFGGPWREIELVAHRVPAWQNIRIQQDWQSGKVHVQSTITELSTELSALLQIVNSHGQVVAQSAVTVTPAHPASDFRVQVSQPERWSPAHPALYQARLLLKDGDQIVAQTQRTFGFRGLHADGDQLLLNGQAVHVRGILSWGWYPETLAPTPTEDQIRDEFRRVRELGFNLYKLCLYVPIPRLFEIANEEGMLLWLELPLWWQRLTDHLRQQTIIEYDDILRTVHTHPSLVLVSLGCELGSDMADAAMLEQLSNIARSFACGTLLCDNSGSGEAYKGLGFDYSDFTDYHFYCDLHYFSPLMDHFRRDWQKPRPWIFGEFCANEDYRDPTALLDAGKRPWWRDIFGVGSGIDRWAYSEQETRIAAHQLPFTHKQLERIARQQSMIVRKNIIEQARSRRDGGGYVVTGLRDTPINTSGIFDDFDRHKLDPATFRSFNADTVLLLEQGRARVWIDGDRPAPVDRFNHLAGSTLSLRLLLAHIGADLPAVTLTWNLLQPDGSLFTADSLPIAAGWQAGAARQIARFEIALPLDAVPGKWTIQASLGEYSTNSWSLWIYPQLAWSDGIAIYDPTGCLCDFDDLPRLSDPTGCTGVLIASAYTPEIAAYVHGGGKVVLLQNGNGALPAKPAAFWQESIKLFYEHPALARFPHEGVTDVQFYHLASEYAFDSAQFSAVIPDLKAIKPVIRRLHARLFRVLDYLVECESGQGRMIASSLRFCGGAGDQVRGIKNNIAGEFLLKEIVAYLSNS
jgi:hypothetical protein